MTDIDSCPKRNFLSVLEGMSCFTHLVQSKLSHLSFQVSARSSSSISDFKQLTRSHIIMSTEHKGNEAQPSIWTGPEYEESHQGYDAEQRIWSGPDYQPEFDLNSSIGRIVYDVLKATPDKVCEIHDGGKVLTNADVLTTAIRLAQHFKKMGLTHEDIIGITAKGSPHVISLVIGCFMNCTPYNGVNMASDFKRLYSITKPKLIFCDGANYVTIAEATKDLNPTIYTLTDHLPGVPSIEQLLEPTGTEQFYEPVPLALGSYQTMAILTSSGTTGPAKPISVSNMALINQHSAPSSENLILGFSGVDWVSGLVAILLSLLRNCRRLIGKKPFTPEYFVELVRTYKPTVTFLTPSTSAAIARCPTATPKNLAAVRQIIVGGGSIPLGTLEILQAKMPETHISYAYAMTETFAISSNEGLANGTSAGEVVPGVRIRIVDEHERNLGPNEVGEVLVNNGIKWQGYYGDPEGTKSMLDDAGWIHTGDMGYFDDQEILYLVGRKKETLTCYSVQFWPREIETVIHEIPGILDCYVVGVPSEVCGDAPGALVIKEKGSQLTAEDIKEHVAKRLAVTSKHLHAGVAFVEELPYNHNTKVITHQAREVFLKEIAKDR